MRKATLLLAVLTACSKQPSAIDVGEYSADIGAVTKRTAQVRLLHRTMAEGDAAAGIIEGWAAAAVLRAHGKEIGRDELVKERARLEADQKIARLYREVAKIYGDDQELFLKVGLLPDMAMRRAAEIYQDASAGASESQELAAELLRKAQSAPDSFAAAATAVGADVREIIISADGLVRDDRGTHLSPFAKQEPSEGTVAKKVYTLAQGAKPGTVLGLVLRTPAGHLIARRLRDEKDGIRLLAAVTRNRTFGEWLQSEAKALSDAGKLRVCINDDNLRAAYLQTARTNLLNCPPK